MVVNRTDWRLHGDLLEWIATTFPGLTNAQFEAGYRLLANPNISDGEARRVEMLMRGCIGATDREEE
jgi:hypothetical protein